MSQKDKEISSTIAANIYHFTGCGDYPPNGPIVTNIERRVFTYLNAIRQRAVKKSTIKKKSTVGKKVKKSNVKIDNLKPADIYEALRGTPEYYGVKYCILWKKLKRKLETEAEDPMEIVEEDHQDMDASETVDVLQNALDKLNDGSKEYNQYVHEKEEVIRHADMLTHPMTLFEYQQYHKKPKIKFTKDMLRHWLKWDKISADMSTIFAWLTVYKIRKVLIKATKHYDTICTSLFFSEETQLKKQRQQMLDLTHFVDGNTVTEELKQDALLSYTEYDNMYRFPVRKEMNFSRLDSIAAIRQEMQEQEEIDECFIP